MEGTNGLTAKQFEFALEYASGEHKGNATKAYLKAYGCTSENGAAASASVLLRKPNVAKLISEVLSKREEAAVEQERGWVELSVEARRRHNVQQETHWRGIFPGQGNFNPKQAVCT